MTYKTIYITEIYAMWQRKMLQKLLLKNKSKITKEWKHKKYKMGQWTNNDKIVYIREDLAYKMIRYTNLGVIEGDQFRKNLGITNNQSIRIEREIIATIMKIFVKESMRKQYQDYLVVLICVFLLINWW